MKLRKHWTLALIFPLAIAAGCQKEPETKTSLETGDTKETEVQKTSAQQAQEKAAEEEPDIKIESSVPLVARVNGEGITQNEFDKIYYEILKNQNKAMTPEEKFQVRLNVLDTLIKARIIKQQALAADLPVAATDVDQAVEKVLQENFGGDRKEMLKALADQGMTLDQYRKSVKNEMKRMRFEKKKMDEFDVRYTREDLKDWYEQHKDSYVTKEVINVSQILLKLPPEPNEEQIKESLEEANDLREQIVNQGADFAEMARIHSDDVKSATRGGLLGDIVKGGLPPAFENEIFSLAVGEVSVPIRTTSGVHLIQVNSRILPKQLSFEEAMEMGALEKDYEGNQKAQYFADWLGRLRTQTEVEILDPHVVTIR